MSYGALGLVEVLGSCNAVVVLDQMLKHQMWNFVPGIPSAEAMRPYFSAVMWQL